MNNWDTVDFFQTYDVTIWEGDKFEVRLSDNEAWQQT